MENIRELEQQPLNVPVQDDEVEIDLREIFYLLMGNIRAIFLAMLVGAVILGVYHTFLVKPSYRDRN